jgi:hypothetical protein
MRALVQDLHVYLVARPSVIGKIDALPEGEDHIQCKKVVGGRSLI